MRATSQGRRDGMRAEGKTGQLAVKTRAGNEKNHKEKWKEALCMQMRTKKDDKKGGGGSEKT